MSAYESDLPDLEIHTEYGIVTRLPTSLPLTDPDLDAELDPDLFQQGFDDTLEHLAQLPTSWARHLAATSLDQPADLSDEPSYTRGYRAALYGFLRHS